MTRIVSGVGVQFFIIVLLRRMVTRVVVVSMRYSRCKDLSPTYLPENESWFTAEQFKTIGYCKPNSGQSGQGQTM